MQRPPCTHHAHSEEIERAEYLVRYRNGLEVGEVCAEHLVDFIEGIDVVIVESLADA